MEKTLKVYRASAGSGKTFTLAAEYIALLLGGSEDAHRGLLAVTFTNAATAEMKTRIVSELCDLAQGVEGDFAAAVREKMGVAPDTPLRTKAREALRALIHDYDHFAVTTIDSFFQRLLTSLGHELGLAADLRVDLDDVTICDAAVNSILQSVNSREDVKHWVREYIRTNVEDEKGWSITEEIKKFAENNVLSEEFQRGGEELLAFINDDEKMRAYRDKLYAIKQQLKNEMDVLVKPALTLLDSFKEEDVANRGSIMRSFLQKSQSFDKGYSPGKRILEYIEYPERCISGKLRKDSACLAEATRLSHALASVLDYRKEAIPLYNSCELTLQWLGPLRLLGVIAEEMNEISAELGLMLLSVTKLLLGEMVKDSDAPFVLEKAGTRYQHAMVDEFQDTSRSQWQSIRSLIRELSAHGQRSLIVGDVKQSIYRWRGGDWSILQGIESDKAFQGVTDTQTLDTNFRSRREVVDFVARLFPVCAKLLDGLGKSDVLTNIYKDTRQRVPSGRDGGYVRLTLSHNEAYTALPKLEEDDLMPEYSLPAQMRRLHALGVPYSAMAILVRKNKETQELLTYFSAHCPDIPLISEEAFQLSSSPAVQLVVNALRYLHDREDTVAACYCARTWCGFVRRSGDDEASICANPTQFLPPSLTDDVTHAQLRRLPLYELCQRLIALFGLDTVQTQEHLAGSAAFLLRFQDSVLAYLKDNTADLPAFLKLWDERIAKTAIPSGNVEGVMIQTIHKSKGLEYHTVFIPFSTWEIEEDASGSKDNICWWHTSAAPFSDLPLVPIKLTKQCAQSVYEASYQQEHLQQRVENLNLAYVAFTRPRYNLLLWTQYQPSQKVREGKEPVPLKKLGPLLQTALAEDKDILPQTDSFFDGDLTIYEVGTPEPLPPVDSKPSTDSSEQRNPFKVTPLELPMTIETFPLRAEFRQSGQATAFLTNLTEEEQQRAHYIEIGNIYHYLFSQIRSTGDVERAAQLLVRQGILPAEVDAVKLAADVRRHIAQSRVGAWFDGSWKLYSERALLYRDADGDLQTRRPDRVMRRGAETVVVDFKFATPRPAHEEQVREYVDLLRRAGYENVRGYLWYVYRNYVVEVR